jgi:cellulose biosynthesis protein BcsQ
MLANKGKRVLMVDADPQCNLTGVVLGLNPEWPDDELDSTQQEQDITGPKGEAHVHYGLSYKTCATDGHA